MLIEQRIDNGLKAGVFAGGAAISNLGVLPTPGKIGPLSIDSSYFTTLQLAGLYSLYLFYKGAPTMMDVPKDKAVVYTILTVVAAIIANIIISMIATAITGPAAISSGSIGTVSDRGTTIDLGEYGSIAVDEDGNTTTATFNVDGEEMTIETRTDGEE